MVIRLYMCHNADAIEVVDLVERCEGCRKESSLGAFVERLKGPDSLSQALYPLVNDMRSKVRRKFELYGGKDSNFERQVAEALMSFSRAQWPPHKSFQPQIQS